MATLTDDQRQALWAEFMREFPKSETLGALTKTDLRAAIDALDAFFSANVTAINNAIPLPARAAMTAKQKALMLICVNVLEG